MFVRTQRLTLRPGWIEDAPELTNAIGKWEVVRNLSRAPWPYTLAHAEAFLMRERAPSEGLLIVAPGDFGDRIIGCMGLRHENSGRWELGYWLIPEAWGRGYATEAGRGMIAFAQETLHLPAIDAGYHIGNPASGRVLAKLGFIPTGARTMTPCLARGAPVETVRVRRVLETDSDDEPSRMAA